MEKFFQTERENQRSFEVLQSQTYVPQVDLRLKSSEFVKKGSIVPIIPKPLENTTVKYRPFIEESELIMNTQQPNIPEYTPAFDKQTSKANPNPTLAQPIEQLSQPSYQQNGSIQSYSPLPPGNRYLERTTNSTTYPTDVQKHYINIDTRFRNNPTLTTSTNFRWRLFRPIKNAISIRVASIEIPNNFYTFSAHKKNIEFSAKLSTSPSYTLLTLEEGNYTSSEIVTALQDLLQTIDVNFTVDLSYISGKILISNLVNNFDIQFPKEENYEGFGWGLGYYLGFSKSEYLNNSSLKAERVVDLLGDNYIFLQIGDYEGIQHEVEKQGLISATAKIVVTSDKYQILFDDGSNLISKEVLFPMPQNISAFNVRLIDSSNKDIDMEGTNFSFTLEIVEIVNSRLYSAYSDNLLQNSETPR